jgi:hypothetical protein
MDLCALSSEPVDRVWERLAPLRPARPGGEKPPNMAWWIWPEKNDTMVHLACSRWGAGTGIWMNLAVFGLPWTVEEQIREECKQRLHGIFPEQTSGTCA